MLIVYWSFDRHISLIGHKATTRARLILKCFLSLDRELLFKAYCVYVRPLLEYCSAVWSLHFKFLVFKMESVQRFFTKRLQGMWRQGYEDRLRLLNTHSLEYRRLYSDLVLCFQRLSNGFNSQLANVQPNYRTWSQTYQTNLLCECHQILLYKSGT